MPRAARRKARRIAQNIILARYGYQTYHTTEPATLQRTKPGNPRPVSWLRPHERAVYEMLTDPQHVGHRRIEQERIPLAVALEQVLSLTSVC